MLLSKHIPVAKALTAVLAVISFAVLSGCQVRPLYATTDANSELASIAISPAKSRVEQQVRNNLIFILNGGEGEPSNPQYDLTLKVSSSNQEFFSAKSSSAPLPGHLIITTAYSLTKSGKVIAKATRTTMALVDHPSQEFARIRAIRDAENRAARESAEQIRTDLAIALQKH